MALAPIAAQLAARRPIFFRRAFLFAGSFDPFASHHLRIIDLLTEFKRLVLAADPSVPVDIVVWPVGAYASKQQVAAPENRVALLRLGLGTREVVLQLDDLSHDAFGYTSTYEMQNRLSLQHRAALEREYDILPYMSLPAITEVWHVIGADNVGQIREWNEGFKLWHHGRFIVIDRPGVTAAALPPRSIVLSSGAASDVSSSRIRELIAAHEPWEHLVPERVADYIKTHGLYQSTLTKKGSRQ